MSRIYSKYIQYKIHTSHWPVCLQVNGKNTHGPSGEGLTPLILKLITNADTRDGKKQVHIRWQTNPETRLITMFPTILLHLLSVEIKVANLENKQSHRNQAQCYHKWPKVRWLSTNPFSNHYNGSCTHTGDVLELWEVAVFAVVATAEAPARVRFQTSY